MHVGYGGMTMAVGDNIKKIRLARGMTMPQLSDAAGVAGPSLFMWEKNRQTPTDDDVERIAAALGVEPHELTGRRPKREEPQPAPTQQARGAFDMALITKVYNCVRDHAASADAVELATARTILHESLKIVKERIKSLEEDEDDADE